MPITNLPPPPTGYEYGEYPWLDWWQKVRDYTLSTYTIANTASTGLASKLNKDAADVLNGTITFDTLGAFKVGTVTWDGTTATGTGVMFTQNGIVGASGGSPKFVLKSDGTATFAGTLSAATGSFGAVTADSSVQVSNTGYFSSANKTSYADTDAGFWMGYDTSAYKVNIGDSTKYIKWTGSNVEVSGDIDTNGLFRVTGSNTVPAIGDYSAIIEPASETANGIYITSKKFGITVRAPAMVSGASAFDANVTGSGTSGITIQTNSSSSKGISVKASGDGIESVCTFGTGTAIIADWGPSGTWALDIIGKSRTNNQLVSTLATGTAPFDVTSTTKVTNLNADRLDDYHAGNASGNIPVSNGTVNTNLVASSVNGTITTTTTCNSIQMNDVLCFNTATTSPGGTGFAVTTETGWIIIKTIGGSSVKIPYWSA
jgi:hypothetical protein